MAIVNRLKVILAEKNISQTKIVEDLGINKSTISNIISGRQNATLEQALDLAEYLKIKVEDIFYKEKTYKTNPEANTDFSYLIKQINQTYILHENEIISEDQLKNLYKDFKKDFVSKHGDEILDPLVAQYCEKNKDNDEGGMDLFLIANY